MIEKNSHYYLRISLEKGKGIKESIQRRLALPKSFWKGVIVGACLIMIIEITSAIVQGIIKIFQQIGLVIGVWLAIQLGIDKEYKWFLDPPNDVIERADNGTPEEKERANAIRLMAAGEISLAMIFGLVAWVVFTGSMIWDLFAIGIPIINDLSFETDFAKFNLLHWLKFLTTWGQFILMLVISRKLRRKIKQKINDKYCLQERFSLDGFDRAFFEPAI